MIIPHTKSLISEFRASRNQTTEVSKPTEPRKKATSYSPYDSFLSKYYKLEECIDNFGTRDLVYYFREIANENGYNYVISNIKKDMAIMKRLKENFSNQDICGMIEFLYESEQNYLQKDRLSINLLSSQWINTIYADTKLWLNSKYKPNNAKREWKTKNTETKIGDWE